MNLVLLPSTGSLLQWHWPLRNNTNKLFGIDRYCAAGHTTRTTPAQGSTSVFASEQPKLIHRYFRLDR
jgi:hypothetical protein